MERTSAKMMIAQGKPCV